MLINDLIYECDERYVKIKIVVSANIVNARLATKVIVLNV